MTARGDVQAYCSTLCKGRDVGSVSDGTGAMRMRVEADTQQTTHGRGQAVDALTGLAARLPLDWEWNAVPGLRLAVRDGTASASATLVGVEGSFYVAQVEPDAPWLEIARVGRPRDAVEALARMFAVLELVARTGFAGLGGIA